MSNAMIRLTCYWANGTWNFDDASKGLVCEPFVCGVDKIITFLAKAKGVSAIHGDQVILTFSVHPFPGHQGVFKRGEPEAGGCWYSFGLTKGWLCPALFCYFDEPPENIYFLVEKHHADS